MRSRQSSVPKAFDRFDANGRMEPSGYRDRVVDVMEELFRFTLLHRDSVDVLSTRYSEEKERRQHGALESALGVAAKE